jgi:Domain of unknown function (DUF4431)
MRKLSLLLCLIGLATPSLCMADNCLSYNQQSTTLRGIVTQQTFFGPPNFGETPEIDKRETQSVLMLAEPICVTASDDEDAEQNQLQVTLVPRIKISLKALDGKQVKVTGKLFHAHTGHHHTPLLLELVSIKNAK